MNADADNTPLGFTRWGDIRPAVDAPHMSLTERIARDVLSEPQHNGKPILHAITNDDREVALRRVRHGGSTPQRR